MDYYHYGNGSSSINDAATTTASNSTNEDHAIISYHQQQQLQSFSYNNDNHNNNEFHGQNIDTNNTNSATTIQLLDSPTDEIFHRLQQRWDIYNSSSSSSHMLTSSEIINNEELNQHHERGIAGFVSKLYQCLQALDDGHKYARWCRHNGIDMFIIDCIPKFTEIVLPRLFKHCKFASFVRQLNIYGFQRDTDARKSKDSRDKETCRWHHIHFRPGRRDLFHLIRRKTPRYSRSRRKRPKMTENDGEEEEGKELEDDDPETILYTGSGDDDELDSNIILLDEGTQSSSFDDTHRSASLVSSPTMFQQQQQYSINTNFRQQQLQTIYDRSPQELVVDNYLQVTQPQSSSTTSSPQYCHFPSNDNINCNTTKSMMPLIIVPTLSNGSEIVDDSKNNVNGPNELFLFQQTTTHHHQQLQQQQQENEVDHLRSEIEQLRKGYLKMYKMLSGEVDKAAHLISSQRSRIEYLENVIRNNNNSNITQQQQQLQSLTHQVLPFINTATASSNDSSCINYFTSNNNNDSSGGILYHHSSANTTPTTAVCPQVTANSAIHQNVIQQQLSPSNSGNSRVSNEGYNFLFSNNTSNNSNNSSNSNESKLSITNGKWTSTSQNLALIQQNNNHL